MGEMIEFERPDGGKVPGYYAAKDESAPGVVVIQEWWGLIDEIKSVADRLSNAGFRALVPDLFRGRKAAKGDEANHLLEGLDFQDALQQDVRGALLYLKKNGAKAGVLGYCMGGALALLAAMHLPEDDASVVFYGFPPAEAGDPSEIRIPLQLHFGTEDEFFKPERAREIESKLKAGGVDHEFHWYEGAHHGFCNPNQPGNSGLGNYDAQAAAAAWQRAVDFLTRTLSRR
ncbi:MAG TPA: dienelactone hydrolase family protein [Candidatus Baltobacteraceae bacterium]|nr:dienelactone hydrolase family protein [Candidatus Baltobacteraceae bacterium]